jgi:glycosyltransferase involved in cell wall biosynthesis
MARPCIAFNGGSLPDIIDHGTTGWIVREYSSLGFAKAMAEAYESMQRLSQMGIAARARTENLFRIDRMCREYANLYNCVAPSRS